MKKEGRDSDPSIKDEQHHKCIKRGDEHTCSGRERCKPGLNAWRHTKKNGLLFDFLQARGSWENGVCFETEIKHQMEVIGQKKGNTNTVYFMQILN